LKLEGIGYLLREKLPPTECTFRSVTIKPILRIVVSGNVPCFLIASFKVASREDSHKKLRYIWQPKINIVFMGPHETHEQRGLLTKNIGGGGGPGGGVSAGFHIKCRTYPGGLKKGC